MELNFDTGSLGKYRLGEPYETSTKRLQLPNKENGYCIYVNDNLVDGLFLCYANGYHDYECYSGELIWKGSKINIERLAAPADFDEFFGIPAQSFDDGTEVSREYLLGEYLVELSWHYNPSPMLTYIIIEKSKQ